MKIPQLTPMRSAVRTCLRNSVFNVWRSLAKRVPILRSMRHSFQVGRTKLKSRTLESRTIDDSLVVFQSYNGRYACSPKAIYESMLADSRCQDFRFIWVVHDRDEYVFLPLQDARTSLVDYRSPEYFAAFDLAKYWVVNGLLSTRIVKSPQQVMLQCWHGTPLKRLRSDIVESTQGAMNSLRDFKRKNRLDVRRFDHFLSPSPDATTSFTSAFDLNTLKSPNIIREIGYPRNDILVSATDFQRLRARRALGIPDGKKVILYAPTWRDDQHDSALGYVHHNEIDFRALRRELGTEYVILYRAHYMIAKSFNFTKHSGFVRDVSAVDDVNELYLASDALVTDYSSSMFDFANLRRPIFFYMYDRAFYNDKLRGLYYDTSVLPGTIFEDAASLTLALRDLSGYYRTYEAQHEAFRKRFNPLEDGNSAKRAVDVLLNARRPAAVAGSEIFNLNSTQPQGFRLPTLPTASREIRTSHLSRRRSTTTQDIKPTP